MAYKKSDWRSSVQVASVALTVGFLSATVPFTLKVDALAARQQRVEQLVSAIAPLRQMQAMAARFERALWEPEAATKITAFIYQRARELGLDPLLVEAIIIIESARDTNAVSVKGARGLMQLMPEHLEPGEDPHEPILNIKKGTAYYAQCKRRSRGNRENALYRYNAGINSDPRKGLAESVDFMEKVSAKYAKLKSL